MTIDKPSLNGVIQRLDEMMAQLAVLREELTTIQRQEAVEASLADTLYGALGQGTQDEYDSISEWERFA